MFGHIRSITLDEAFSVYVADAQSMSVRVFDSLGQYKRTIGRDGQGPGEFRSPYSLAWMEDLLIVQDPGNARIGQFTRTGEWVGSWQWQPLTGPEVRLLNGSPYDLYAPVAHRIGARTQLTWISLTNGAVPDTMIPPNRPEFPSGPVCRYPNNQGIEFFGIPYRPHLRIAGAPLQSMYLGWSASYEIAQVTLSGDTIRLIERSYTSIPITDEEWAQGTQAYRTLLEERPDVNCDPSEQPRPKSKPAYRWLGGDVDQRLWVEVYTSHGFVFEIFNANGALTGRVQLPVRDEQVTPAPRGNRIAIVTQDSLDVQYVEIYAVDSPGN